MHACPADSLWGHLQSSQEGGQTNPRGASFSSSTWMPLTRICLCSCFLPLLSCHCHDLRIRLYYIDWLRPGKMFMHWNPALFISSRWCSMSDVLIEQCCSWGWCAWLCACVCWKCCVYKCESCMHVAWGMTEDEMMKSPYELSTWSLYESMVWHVFVCCLFCFFLCGFVSLPNSLIVSVSLSLFLCLILCYACFLDCLFLWLFASSCSIEYAAAVSACIPGQAVCQSCLQCTVFANFAIQLFVSDAVDNVEGYWTVELDLGRDSERDRDILRERDWTVESEG